MRYIVSNETPARLDQRRRYHRLLVQLDRTQCKRLYGLSPVKLDKLGAKLGGRTHSRYRNLPDSYQLLNHAP